MERGEDGFEYKIVFLNNNTSNAPKAVKKIKSNA